MKNNNLVLYILGSILVITGIMSYSHALFVRGELEQVFWLSYLMVTLLGISIMIRNDFLIAGCLNIILIPYTLWTIDFIYFLLTSSPLFGITDYFFQRPLTIGNMTSLQHIFTVPISLFALSLIKLKRKDSWKISVLIVSLAFSTTLIMTSSESNVNYIFGSPKYSYIPDGIYQIIWFMTFFTMIFISHKIISSLNFLKIKKSIS